MEWQFGFNIHFSVGVWKWGQNYDLSIFQVLCTEAFLCPQMNSLGWYYGSFDILFVSECSGWSEGRTWKMDKIYQNLKIFRIHVNGLWQPIPMEK